ncbi:hypothetical protein SORBI_3008G120000 [Sorghum bicolor]|uniref:Uncharacterized protein n=1 Tax=Sorghum bicolor TaxID=4558 RepID=A0A1B6PD73_SORBI|nr:hypothetical protein SORBI_3008G120000 [Sorghum bicolor]
MASAGLSEQGPPVAGDAGALRGRLLETLGSCARGHGRPVPGSGPVVPSMAARAPAQAGLRRGRTCEGRGSRLRFWNSGVSHVPYAQVLGMC